MSTATDAASRRHYAMIVAMMVDCLITVRSKLGFGVRLITRRRPPAWAPRLDGIYVIRTSAPVEQLDAHETVQAYKDRARVEHAFRSIKTVDLGIRPIRHWTAQRVRAHVFLCLLAYHVEWHFCARP